MEGRFFQTDRGQYLNHFGRSSGEWQASYGCSMNAIFKGFTTLVSASGVPHYETPLWGGQAISTNLNPYGPFTLHEDIIWGTGMAKRFATGILATNARPLGLKAPFTMVGWGYDTFGYPAPNFDTAYRTSGVSNGTIAPSSLFWSTGVQGIGAGKATGSLLGKDVPSHRWLAGPLDIQWDMQRKVWTFTDGCYPARIFATQCSGGVSETLPQFAERVTYSARTMNPARFIQLTGVFPIDKRPAVGSYMIQPLVSGDPCFIVAETTGTFVRYSLMVFERFAPSGC